MSASAAGVLPAERTGAAATGLVARLRALALRSLRRMYRADERQFVFRLRRSGASVVAEGLSPRYTAIALLGLAGEDAAASAAVLGDHGVGDVWARLLRDAEGSDNLGDVALTLWAGHAMGRADRSRALERLLGLDPARRTHPTVELAWTLSALALDAQAPVGMLRQRVAERLLEAFRPAAGVFPHVVGGGGARSHVCCFADLVYPIQALSLFHGLTGERRALEAALRCGEHICRVQGEAGQWWWHYDVRTGRVVEGYPVYAIHQDAMAPMALFALQQASGRDFGEPVRRGLGWLERAPELDGGSLIDERADLVWRKVARREPAKLSRYLQAAASRVHSGLRVPGLDILFPALAIDHEDRPYHLGWLLHAFPGGDDRSAPSRRDVRA
jgi:hypothetical protein